MVKINYGRSLCRFWKNEFIFSGEHYWEINSAKKYSRSKIRRVMEQYFCVISEYLVPENPYHRFYILQKE